MAAKKTAKKTLKKVVKSAKAAAEPKVAAAKKSAKKTAKKAVKQAQGLLGKLAQKSAQLIIDSGLLGELPADATAKKKRRPKA
jgi:cell division septum initiation protein DivIVA